MKNCSKLLNLKLKMINLILFRLSNSYRDDREGSVATCHSAARGVERRRAKANPPRSHRRCVFASFTGECDTLAARASDFK